MSQKETMKTNSLEPEIIEQQAIDKKYYNFFEYTPIALFIEDFSKVKQFVAQKAKENSTDIELFLENNPSVVEDLYSLVVIKDVNVAAVKLYKATSKNDLLENLGKIFTKDSIIGFSKLIRDILSGKKEISIETVNQNLVGEEIKIILKYNIESGSEETLENVIVSIEDITESVKTRNALAISEKRYKESQEIAKMASWFYDFKTQQNYWSDEVFKMIGLSPNNEALSLEYYLSFVHEDDKKRVGDFSFKNLLKNPNQNLNYKIYTKQGEIKHLYEKRSVVIKDGRVERIIGICQDISERVISGKSLSVTKQLLSNTLSSIQDGFVILDENSNYLYVNQVAAKLLGKKEEELIGRHIWTEFPEKEGYPFFDNYQIAFKSRKPLDFENYFAPWNRWFKNRIIPSNNSMLLFFHEITEDRKSVV